MDAPLQAVEHLGIRPFIDDRMEIVYARLKEAVDAAENVTSDPADRFVETTLPIVNGLIHYATSPDELDAALAWVRADWKITTDDEAMSMLPALVLLYIVDRGLALATSTTRAQWQRMKEHVTHLAEEIEAAA
jgi:hypothetical protein